jgi:hypothetical protein
MFAERIRAIKRVEKTSRCGSCSLGLGPCECGVVESTLVLVPTLALFLAVSQIALVGLAHGRAANQTQRVLARGALYQNQSSSELIGASETALSGGGRILYLERTYSAPNISPFGLGAHLISSRTLAIDENQ